MKAYGIKQLTTFNRDWIGNPQIIVIAAVGLGSGIDGRVERVLGGARMHGAKQVSELPLMQAVGGQDPRLSEHMKPYVEEGAFELGGMWNSIELAGMGGRGDLSDSGSHGHLDYGRRSTPLRFDLTGDTLGCKDRWHFIQKRG